MSESVLSMEDIKACVRNTVNVILCSNQYEDAVSYTEKFEGLGEYMIVK